MLPSAVYTYLVYTYLLAFSTQPHTITGWLDRSNVVSDAAGPEPASE